MTACSAQNMISPDSVELENIAAVAAVAAVAVAAVTYHDSGLCGVW